MSLPANNTFQVPPPVPLPPPPPRRRGRRLFAVSLLLIWLAGLGLIAANRQNIFDWWVLRDYQAPAAISALADQDTMTDYGRRVFYVNQPVIDDKQAFVKSCPANGGEQTIVLGCYHGGQSGIFLLKVNDPRLNGVLQVTAAHEMLHGAYDRLSSTERKRVDAMLIDYYRNGLKDPRVLKTIAAYKKSEPNDVVNEMHSVFGTEIADLPSGLEEYYQRYFSDRGQVASYAAQYQAQFTDREALVARYDAQMASLRNRINGIEKNLQSQSADISALQSKLTSQKNSGDISGYNADIPAYNNLVNAYNAEIQTVKDLIAQYNRLVGERNAVALEEDQLVKDLSTDDVPAQQ